LLVGLSAIFWGSFGGTHLELMGQEIGNVDRRDGVEVLMLDSIGSVVKSHSLHDRIG
jgi:hypothetical protein